MKFAVVTAGAFAAVASALPATIRADTTQMFEFQDFSAACSATSTDCTFAFKLNGVTDCTASQPAFTGQPGSYKELPNIGQTSCGDIQWSAARSADGNFTIAAKQNGASGISGSTNLPSTDFSVADGVEKYVGSGIVILYGTAQ